MNKNKTPPMVYVIFLVAGVIFLGSAVIARELLFRLIYMACGASMVISGIIGLQKIKK